VKGLIGRGAGFAMMPFSMMTRSFSAPLVDLLYRPLSS